MSRLKSIPPSKTNAVRRILAMAVFGAALAMAVVHFTNTIQHDIQLRIGVAPNLRVVLGGLDITVLDEEAENPPLSMTLFQFDETRPTPRTITHRLRLTNGRYLVVIRVQRTDGHLPVTVKHPLEVDADATISIRLP